MARGGGRRTYVRDANGRFASTGGGSSGRSKGGTLGARSSLKKSRSKLASKDPADKSLQGTLSRRSQKGAVTRGNKALKDAKASSRKSLNIGKPGGTIGKKRGGNKTLTAKTAKLRTKLTPDDLVRRLSRLDTNKFQDKDITISPSLRRQRQVTAEADPRKRASLERKLDKARTIEDRGKEFRKKMGGVSGLGGYWRAIQTDSGKSELLNRYKARPRYSTKQKVKPTWRLA